MTRDEFAEIVVRMKVVFADNDFIKDKAVFNVWYELLCDLRFDVCKKAVDEYMRKWSKPPAVADIRNEYKLLWDEYTAMVRHINDEFENVASVYPGIDAEKKKVARSIFIEMVNRYPKEQKERIAGAIASKVRAFSREWESGTERTIMPLDEYMRQIEDEFAG